jgi:N-acylglucosamine-6-phosphate 2-epimerase
MTWRPKGPVEPLAGGLIVSCQALPGDPLDRVEGLVAIARSAEIGGAVGLRVARVEVVAAVRRVCAVPIIGITKHPDRTRAFVTPVLEDARALVEAGADIVAVDATDRERPSDLTAVEYIRLLREELAVPIMADVSTEGEGKRAFEAGAELVATTLAGYTPYSPVFDGPDLELIRRLADAGRVVAEGRIHTPEQLAAAFEAGAYAVVVGRAITRPQDITARFAALTPRLHRAREAAAAVSGSVLAPRASSPAQASRSDGHGLQYWLGIDGGQSGLRSVILCSDGSIHGTGSAAPTGFVLASGGQEALAASLTAAIREAMGSRPVPIEAAFLGLSGIVAGGRLEQAVREAAAEVVPAERVFVDTDTYAAWAGALGLRPGLVALAGTGSGVMGRDGRGQVARAGGWGYLFGDEAGAFGIACAAIRLALRQLDSGSAASELAGLITTHFGLPGVAEVPKAFYAGEIDWRRTADLTRVLASAAADGDEILADLFADAAHVLARQLVQVARQLTWEQDQLEWAAAGGVFGSGPLIVDQIVQDLEAQSDLRFVLVPPKFPPPIGSALLAAERSGRGANLVELIAAKADIADSAGHAEASVSRRLAAVVGSRAGSSGKPAKEVQRRDHV